MAQPWILGMGLGIDLYPLMQNLRKALTFSFLMAILLSSMPSASSAELEVGTTYWVLQGEFDMTGGPPNAPNRWNLTHPVDSTTVVLTGEVRLHPRISFQISYGFGDIEEGTIRDIDYDASGVVSNLSYSTSSGDTRLHSYRVYLRVWSRKKGYLDLSLGYLYLKNSVTYRDPRIEIYNYLPSTLSWEEVWLTYELTYRGVWLGVRGRIDLFSDLSIKGSAGYIPWLDAEYDGLRYPERPPSKRQIERIDAEGWAYEVELAGGYRPSPNLVLDGGYRYMRFDVKGRDSPDTAWANSWEHIKTDFRGPFLRLSYSF